jgi:hypothetical protein
VTKYELQQAKHFASIYSAEVNRVVNVVKNWELVRRPDVVSISLTKEKKA